MGEKETGRKEIMVWGDDTREAYEVARLNGEIPSGMSYKQFKKRSEGGRDYPKWGSILEPLSKYQCNKYPRPTYTKMASSFSAKATKR